MLHHITPASESTSVPEPEPSPPRRPTLEHLAQVGYEASMQQLGRKGFVPWPDRTKALHDHWMAVASAIVSSA